jgi:hypothetical protein
MDERQDKAERIEAELRRIREWDARRAQHVELHCGPPYGEDVARLGSFAEDDPETHQTFATPPETSPGP